MKNNDLLIIGAVALAFWFLSKQTQQTESGNIFAGGGGGGGVPGAIDSIAGALGLGGGGNGELPSPTAPFFTPPFIPITDASIGIGYEPTGTIYDKSPDTIGQDWLIAHGGIP